MKVNRISLSYWFLLIAGLFIIVLDVKSQVKKPSIGLQMYSLRNVTNSNNIDSVLAVVAAIGYNEIETGAYTNSGKYFGLEPAAFKSLLDKNGLAVPSLHLSYDQLLELTKQQKQEMFDAAKKISAQYLTISWVSERYRKNSDDYLSIISKLTEFNKEVRLNGLILAYHNHDFEFQQFPIGLSGMEMLRNLLPADILFELDIYWITKAGIDPVQWISINDNRIFAFHIKDMDSTSRNFIEVGKGKIDFRNIISHSKRSGVKYYFVEQDEIKGDPFKSVQFSYRGLIRQLN